LRRQIRRQILTSENWAQSLGSP